MIEIKIPGGDNLILDHLVLDYNGTLATDGRLLPHVKETLAALAVDLQVHVITADTFGTVRSYMDGTNCKISVLSSESQDIGKLTYIDALGRERTVAIGNGRNDALMLKAAALGIAVIQEEGAWSGTLQAADVVCTGIISALELLRNPSRLKATLRR
jgi:soluble P-type ATPase